MIAHSLRKIHNSGNREEITVQRLIYIYRLIHYKKKPDNHPAVLLNLFTIHHSVITIFFPNIAFHFLTTIKLIYILVYIYINL
jgi:hypothetical protein